MVSFHTTLQWQNLGFLQNLFQNAYLRKSEFSKSAPESCLNGKVRSSNRSPPSQPGHPLRTPTAQRSCPGARLAHLLFESPKSFEERLPLLSWPGRLQLGALETDPGHSQEDEQESWGSHHHHPEPLPVTLAVASGDLVPFLERRLLSDSLLFVSDWNDSS